VDLTAFGIYSGPFQYSLWMFKKLINFRVTPEDSALDIYWARGSRDAALLIPGPGCFRVTLMDSFPYDTSHGWQSLKETSFANGVREIYLVTEVYTTNRWALDHRSSALALPACYVVNVQNRFHGPQIAPDFRLHHSSGSGNVHESIYQNTHQYTILANHRSVQRRDLGSEGGWLVPFKRYCFIMTFLDLHRSFTRFAKRFSMQRPGPVQTGFSFPLSTVNGFRSSTTVDHVSRLHLEGTLYLLERIREGEWAPRYELESEGHYEGFSLDEYVKTLIYKAREYGFNDCIYPIASDLDE
jgi:hypothetical protein